MAVRNYGDDLAGFAAEIGWLSEKLLKAEELNNPTQDNVAYQIVMMVAIESLLAHQSVSPVDTGMLRDEHRIGDSSISASSGSVTAEAIIDINPDPTLENIKYGGYPGDYGPRYHSEKRAWFREANFLTKDIFAQIVNEQFSLYITTLDF